MQGLLDQLEPLLQGVEAPPGGPDDPLGLDSLQVVMLVDLLEATFAEDELLLGSEDVTREHFKSRAALCAMLRKKGVACG